MNDFSDQEDVGHEDIDLCVGALTVSSPSEETADGALELYSLRSKVEKMTSSEDLSNLDIGDKYRLIAAFETMMEKIDLDDGIINVRRMKRMLQKQVKEERAEKKIP